MINRLFDKREILLTLNSKYDINYHFNIIIKIYEEQSPAIYFENDVLEFINSIGATIDIPIYVYYDKNEEELEIGEKYLPIGSVVFLKGGTKKAMIYGHRQQDTASSKVYDYVGCLYPEGNINKEHTFLFNHDNIAQVCYRGYDDEENQSFTEKLLK